MSRRLKTINNLKYGLLLKCVNIPLQMLIRWVIINYLGVEYLGLNALMLSVLNIIASLELAPTIPSKSSPLLIRLGNPLDTYMSYPS